MSFAEMEKTREEIDLRSGTSRELKKNNQIIKFHSPISHPSGDVSGYHMSCYSDIRAKVMVENSEFRYILIIEE